MWPQILVICASIVSADLATPRAWQVDSKSLSLLEASDFLFPLPNYVRDNNGASASITVSLRKKMLNVLRINCRKAPVHGFTQIRFEIMSFSQVYDMG